MFRIIGIAVSVITTAFALYLTTQVVPGISVYSTSSASDDSSAFVWVALVFVAVNTVLGPILRLVGLPLRFVSYALSGLAVNAALLWVTQRISTELGLGLAIADWFSLFAGAAIMGVAMWLVAALRAFR